MDLVLRVREMPQKGETVTTKSMKKIPGGKGANQACAVGKLGGSCVFLSAVGEDDSGEQLSRSLTAANVDVRHFLRSDTEPTGTAVISVNDEGENSIMIVPGANKLCNEAYFRQHQALIDDADILVTQLETPHEDVYRLIEHCKQAGKLVFLNPAPAPDHIPEAVLQGLDFITPNETELEKLTGMPTKTIPQIESAAEELLRRGVKNVIVTLGAKGALLYNGEGKQLYPTFPAVPVDTTAAGDTFNAGVAVGLAEGKTLSEAIALGNAAASISTTRKGAQTSIPTREEADRLINTR